MPLVDGPEIAYFDKLPLAARVAAPVGGATLVDILSQYDNTP